MAVKKLSKQMEMFDDGGLKDEGGTIDPISGNDVPPGSTQEEVRDDIPAQLSEGEFVFPADVVRFIGLEKLMMMRQEAKMGLKKMEDMGQMGNSEEATMPDDMPFSLEDLDMEDDEPMQEDDSMKMAEGGYVMVAGKPMPIPMIGGQLPPITTKPMPETKNMAVGGFTNPTGTYQVPTNVATQPSYFQNYQQSTAPFSPFNQTQTPIGTPLSTSTPVVGQTGQGPSFNTLMPQLTGKRETLEYRNDAGQKLFIPFIDGKPIYPIPEGYTRYIAEEVTTPDKPTNVQSTSVRQDTGDGGDSNVFSGTSQVRGLDNSVVSTDFTNQTPDKVAQNMGNMSVADRGLAVANAIEQSKGYTGLARGMQQLGALAVPGVMAGKMYGQKTMNPMDVLGQIANPNPAQLNAVLNAFGPSTVGLSPEEIDMQGIDRKEALAQAMGFKDLSTMTGYYGIEPTHVKGFNPGQTDPTHGGIYSINGQTTDANGNVSYSSMADFGRAMNASSKTGYYGTEKQAKTDAKNGNPKAKDFLNRLNANRVMDKQNEKDKQASTRGGRGSLGVSTDQFGGKSLGDGYGIGDNTGPGSQTMGTEDVDTTDRGTNTGSGATAGSPSGGGVSTADDSTGVGSTGDADSPGGGPGGAATEGVFKQGGLLKKKKPKVKKMKRGGLASR